MTRTTAGTATDDPSDGSLTAAVRGGEVEAFGLLYTRHLPAARRAAMSLAAQAAERDDLVAEGFARVLRVLRAGGGPDQDFRPYLLTTMRNTLISWRRRDSSLWLVADVPDIVPGGRHEDVVATRLHADMAADAFAALPERWRIVLWRTEIEGESPAQIARQLGMTANGVAALAYRARQGLREAYLSQYIPTAAQRACQTVAGQLAGWIRHGGTAHKTRRITTHLNQCTSCRDLAAGLREVNQELNSTLVPALPTAAGRTQPALLLERPVTTS